MIFPNLQFESILQVNDRTRLNASKSFSNSGLDITDILIRPEASESFVSVYGSNSEKWFIDWAYSVEGEKVVTVKVVSGATEVEKDYNLTVLSAEDDALLSSDSDLYPYEPTVTKYLPLGKNSFIYAHRAAQSKIIAYLDEQRIWKYDNSRYTKQDLIDIADPEFKEQFKMWSIFQTLLIIFESSQVSTSDIFQEKRKEYEAEMKVHRSRASLRLDNNKDGILDTTPRNIRTTRLVRR